MSICREMITSAMPQATTSVGASRVSEREQRLRLEESGREDRASAERGRRAQRSGDRRARGNSAFIGSAVPVRARRP